MVCVLLHGFLEALFRRSKVASHSKLLAVTPVAHTPVHLWPCVARRSRSDQPAMRRSRRLRGMLARGGLQKLLEALAVEAELASACRRLRRLLVPCRLPADAMAVLAAATI